MGKQAVSYLALLALAVFSLLCQSVLHFFISPVLDCSMETRSSKNFSKERDCIDAVVSCVHKASSTDFVGDKYASDALETSGDLSIVVASR